MARAKKPEDDIAPLTDAQKELVERAMDDVLGDTEPPVDQYLGKSPAEIEERDEQIDREEDRRLNAETPAERSRIVRLEQQIAELNELVQKLAQDRGGYSNAGRAALALNQESERRRIYRRIERNGGKCTILLHRHEDAAQNWPVRVSVNGQSIMIQRGEPTIIPVSHLEVLDHAIVDHWTTEVDENGDKRQVRDVRLSYPYSLLDYTGQRLELDTAAA